MAENEKGYFDYINSFFVGKGEYTSYLYRATASRQILNFFVLTSTFFFEILDILRNPIYQISVTTSPLIQYIPTIFLALRVIVPTVYRLIGEAMYDKEIQGRGTLNYTDALIFYTLKPVRPLLKYFRPDLDEKDYKIIEDDSKGYTFSKLIKKLGATALFIYFLHQIIIQVAQSIPIILALNVSIDILVITSCIAQLYVDYFPNTNYLNNLKKLEKLEDNSNPTEEEKKEIQSLKQNILGSDFESMSHDEINNKLENAKKLVDAKKGFIESRKTVMAHEVISSLLSVGANMTVYLIALGQLSLGLPASTIVIGSLSVTAPVVPLAILGAIILASMLHLAYLGVLKNEYQKQKNNFLKEDADIRQPMEHDRSVKKIISIILTKDHIDKITKYQQLDSFKCIYDKKSSKDIKALYKEKLIPNIINDGNISRLEFKSGFSQTVNSDNDPFIKILNLLFSVDQISENNINNQALIFNKEILIEIGGEISNEQDLKNLKFLYDSLRKMGYEVDDKNVKLLDNSLSQQFNDIKQTGNNSMTNNGDQDKLSPSP